MATAAPMDKQTAASLELWNMFQSIQQLRRREALGLVVLAPLQAQTTWKPEVLTPEQDQTVDVLSELIIPRTETPGAHDAQVNRYIDRMLKDGLTAPERAAFLNGLKWLDGHCRSLAGGPFVSLPPDRQTAILTAMSEAATTDPGRQFFGQMKDMTLRGYYSSKPGLMEELEYKGNGAFSEYPGCTHPEHQK